MALTLNNFVGFETNDLHEALSTTGSPTIEGTGAGHVHSGDFNLRLTGAGNIYDVAMITGGSTDSDNDFILGFFMKVTNDFPSTQGHLLQALDDSGGVLWELDIQLDNDLELLDANGSSVVVATTPFTLNAMHRIEILWQHSASGNFILHVDGTEVINQSGVDLTDGGTISEDLALYRFEGINSYVRSTDDIYCYSGATGVSDFLGNAEIYRYQNNENSATQDGDFVIYNETAGGLDAGVWQDLGETPIASDATEPEISSGTSASKSKFKLANDTQSGNNYRPGPSDDGFASGEIKGGKVLSRLRRGNGSGTTFIMGHANDAVNSNGHRIVSLTTSFDNYFMIVETSDAELPDETEDFGVGFGRSTGGRDIFGEEQFGFILRVPAAGATPPIPPIVIGQAVQRASFI